MLDWERGCFDCEGVALDKLLTNVIVTVCWLTSRSSEQYSTEKACIIGVLTKIDNVYWNLSFFRNGFKFCNI